MNALSLLVKPASGNCNMRCRYCFYADVAERRDVPNYGMMSAATAETLVRKCMAEAGKLCVFNFQGGEPTLVGLDFYRHFVDATRTYNTNSIDIRYSIQTNGISLDAEWAAFLAENRFLVGLSLDADGKRHDAMRPDASGRDTARRVLDAARLLRESDVEFNILSVVTRHAAAHPDTTYRFYKDKGFTHLQFIPCIDPLDEGAGGAHSIDAELYGKFLCRLFDVWYRDYTAGKYVSIRMFDNYIHMLAGHPPENCAMAGRCRTYLLVEADGTVFPCDFYALDKYKLGNIHSDSIAAMLAGEQSERFVAPSHHVHEACGRCEFFPICRGGCRRDREPVVDGVPGLNIHCDAYRAFFAHALPRMASIAKHLFNRP